MMISNDERSISRARTQSGSSSHVVEHVVGYKKPQEPFQDVSLIVDCLAVN